MKLLYVINELSPSGAELVALNLLRALRDNWGCKIHLVALRDTRSAKKRQMFIDCLGEDAITECRLEGMASFRNFVKAVRHARSVVNQFSPDIIHSHCEVPDMIGLLASVGLRTTICVRTCHNERFYGLRAGSVFEYPLSRFFDMNICISKKTQINHRLVPSQVIYNPLRVGYGGGEECLRIRTGLLQVGVVGRITKQKNQLGLLRAIRKLDAELCRRVEFHFYGDGELLAKAKELGAALKTKIIFHGFCRDVDQIYAGMDCMLIPSLFEGLSSVMIEAISRRIPVFSLPVSGVDDINQHLDYSISCISIDSMLRKLLLSVPSISLEESKSISSLFDIETSAGKHYQLYRQLLGGEKA